MSESKTPFNKELIGLLLLFSFLVLWVRAHSQPHLKEIPKQECIQQPDLWLEKNIDAYLVIKKISLH
jgi:hypothetical protein